MMSRVPRKSREVHAERVEWRRDEGLARYLNVPVAVRLLPRREPDECVCEEPCRYCRCEPASD